MSDTGTGAVAGPEDMIQALDGKVPIALLPVRLETSYNADATSLRIRIFPDDVHVHTTRPRSPPPRRAMVVVIGVDG